MPSRASFGARARSRSIDSSSSRCTSPQSASSRPGTEWAGVAHASEVLDTPPCGSAERRGAGWVEIRVRADDSGFAEVRAPAEPADARALDEVAAELAVVDGTRLPIPRGIDAWCTACG